MGPGGAVKICEFGLARVLGRDAGGALQAGARFYVALEWAILEWLWIAEPVRRAGLGSRLLRDVEADARRENCRGVYLDTFTFQAKPFYEKHGYKEFGRLPDMPAGFDRVWMRKHLR